MMDLIDITKILHFVQNCKKQALINFVIMKQSGSWRSVKRGEVERTWILVFGR